MFVAVHHTIHKSAEFWQAIEEMSTPDAAEVRVRRVLRNEPGDRAVILWEARSVDTARIFIERGLGAFSENEYEPVRSLRAWRMQSK